MVTERKETIRQGECYGVRLRSGKRKRGGRREEIWQEIEDCGEEERNYFEWRVLRSEKKKENRSETWRWKEECDKKVENESDKVERGK